MSNPKPCPKCGSTDLWQDSAANAASWIECNDCEYRFQHACSEVALIRKWNQLERGENEEQKP